MAGPTKYDFAKFFIVRNGSCANDHPVRRSIRLLLVLILNCIDTN
jgi:hypothetical protein